MSFTLSQKVFIVRRYLEKKSFKTVQNEFLMKFPKAENVPNKSTILRIMKRFEEMDSVNKLVYHRSSPILMPAILETVATAFVDTPSLSIRRIQQQFGVSYGSLQRVAHILK